MPENLSLSPKELVDVSIIVPCLNEEQNISNLAIKLLELLNEYKINFEVLFVDDLSDDYTFKEALLLEQKYSNIRALHKGMPRGIGNAIKYGVKHAQGKMGVVVMGDLVDPLNAIPEFYNKIVNEGYDLVLLSRYIDPDDSNNIPFLYKFYQFWYRFLCMILLRMKIKDITYAFRGFKIDTFRKLRIESGGFEISPELTIKTFLYNYKIFEIKGRQGRRISGESKFVFSRAGWGYARILLKGTVYKFTKKWIRFRKKFFIDY